MEKLKSFLGYLIMSVVCLGFALYDLPARAFTALDIIDIEVDQPTTKSGGKNCGLACLREK